MADGVLGRAAQQAPGRGQGGAAAFLEGWGGELDGGIPSSLAASPGPLVPGSGGGVMGCAPSKGGGCPSTEQVLRAPSTTYYHQHCKWPMILMMPMMIRGFAAEQSAPGALPRG